MQMKEMEKRIFGVDTELTFGIHKGSTIEEVYEEDCQYLVWMYDEFDNVEWTDDALFLITDAIDILAMDGDTPKWKYGSNFEMEEDSFSIY